MPIEIIALFGINIALFMHCDIVGEIALINRLKIKNGIWTTLKINLFEASGVKIISFLALPLT